MSARRSVSNRGLLAGRLALATFVSAAVAITAHGAGTAPPTVTQASAGTAATAVVAEADGSGGRGERSDDHGGHH